MYLGKTRQLAGIAGVLLLSGCLELGGATAPSRFYLLTPMAETRTGDGDLGLGVGPIRIPAYLDRPQIVLRDRGARIELAQFDRWAEPMQEAVARVMAVNLGRLLGTQRVQRHPWRDSRAVEVGVEVDVLRFDGEIGGGPVLLEALWRVRSASELVQRETRVSEAPSGSGYEDLALAMSRALATLAREIADAVPGS